MSFFTLKAKEKDVLDYLYESKNTLQPTYK